MALTPVAASGAPVDLDAAERAVDPAVTGDVEVED